VKKFGQYGQHRFLEILPGFLIWSTFVLAIVFSFTWPAAVIVFIIVFDLLWLFRVIYFVIYLLFASRQYRRERAVDWFAILQTIPDWRRIYHLIFLPTYKEGYEIMRKALQGLEQAVYPNDRLIVVLAGEQRDHEMFQRDARKLEKEFGAKFFKFIITEHPSGLPNEIPGKGSNLNWAAHRVQEAFTPLAIPVQDIIVSAFDIDTQAHPQYFARLAQLYLTIPDPLHSSYQPVTTFANNIWYASAPVRVGSFGTTFWLLTELARSERMWTFSSHSMSWQMLIDVGFWEKDMVSEDSRIFLQGLLHYHGNYRVTPIFLPVNMDAVVGKNYVASLVALYKQQRRWAWGVEHFAYMVPRFLKDRAMPLSVKLKYTFNHLEGMYTWATAPILIFLLGYLPFWVSTHAVSVLVRTTPFTLEWVMRLASVGVFASALLSFTLLPRRPERVKRGTWIVMVLQWLLLPVTFIVFGSFPAIDAQTRLMLGKYLGFNVTKKYVKK